MSVTTSMKTVVCFGEVLWDVYPDAKRLGGAPFNVAAHLAQLGVEGRLVSRVGDDALGLEIREAMASLGVPTDSLQRDERHPTGTVQVTLDSGGMPSYEIEAPAAWDFITSEPVDHDLVREAEALVYGSLACRSETSLSTLHDLAQAATLCICDLNIRQHYYSTALIDELLTLADILKINDEEAELLIQVLGIPGRRFYTELSERYGLQVIIKTKGADGAEAYAEGHTFTVPGIPVTVVDTVGSGDAFLAAVLSQYLAGAELGACLTLGCKLGAHVATCQGAIPKYDSAQFR